MTDKFENIKNEEIKINENGEIELSKNLADAIAGGFNPEEEEDEGVLADVCGNNCSCEKN